MSEPKKPNVVVAGDGLYAGVDPDDAARCEIPYCLVIQCETPLQMRDAMAAGRIEFDVFRDVEVPS